MSKCYLIQTEKSENLKLKGISTISFMDKNYQPNITQVSKLLAKVGLKALRINSIVSYKKIKQRTKKRRSVVIKRRSVVMFRPKKYMILLESNQIVNDDKIKEINDLFIAPTPIESEVTAS